jgi:hypothetical protein
MRLEKKIFVEVGEKVRIVEPEPEFYAEMEHFLGKEFTIKTLHSTNDDYYEEVNGKKVCLCCPIDEIDVFYVEELPASTYDLFSKNISIPAQMKKEIKIEETDYQKVKYLLSVMEKITVAESAMDMYELAKGAIKKYK